MRIKDARFLYHVVGITDLDDLHLLDNGFLYIEIGADIVEAKVAGELIIGMKPRKLGEACGFEFWCSFEGIGPDKKLGLSVHIKPKHGKEMTVKDVQNLEMKVLVSRLPKTRRLIVVPYSTDKAVMHHMNCNLLENKHWDWNVE